MQKASAGRTPALIISLGAAIGITVGVPHAARCLAEPPPTSAEAAPSVAALPALAPAHAMTLEQALAYARAHQPLLRSALARVNAAGADARVARAQWLPG